MQYLRVKNWEEFQHYKDRSPPWIKLHRTLLDDYEFSALPDATKAHLLLIWVLASQLSGRVPAEPKWLQSKIGAKSLPDIALLISAGFLLPEQDDSNALAERKQDASVVLALARSQEERRGEAEEIARATLDRPNDDHLTLALSLGLNGAAEWEQFEDYNRVKGRRMKDKAAAFRMWLRNGRKYAVRDGTTTDKPKRGLAI
jgi:hypothetical protein